MHFYLTCVLAALGAFKAQSVSAQNVNYQNQQLLTVSPQQQDNRYYNNQNENGYRQQQQKQQQKQLQQQQQQKQLQQQLQQQQPIRQTQWTKPLWPTQRPAASINNLPAQVFDGEKPAEDNSLAPKLNLPQEQPVNALDEAIHSQGQFSTKMLSKIVENIQEDSNLVISPFSIWAVTLLLLEAADGQSAKELGEVLGLQRNPSGASNAYALLSGNVVAANNKGGFSSANFLARDRELRPSPAFSKNLVDDFKARDFSFDPKTVEQNANAVNKFISKKTNGRITNLLKVDDFQNLKVLLGNVAYFKGRWRNPFNSTVTSTDQFKDSRDRVLGNVQMMVDKQVLSYGYSPKFESQMVEIPYDDGKTSMIVVLPKRNISVKEVLKRMSGLGLGEILPEMSEEEVELYLPKFKSQIDLVLNLIFTQLGVQDVFAENTAALPHLSDKAFVSKITHFAEIENNEEGSTASAVTGAHVSYKTSSVTFHANRPFIYFINDIKTRVILFAGTYTNPRII